MSFITINNIWQEYGDHVVLENLNLTVKEGEFCSMVGASGCGKSTFLRLLLGQESQAGAPSRWMATCWPLNRTAAVAWCFSVTLFSRTSACWITLPSVLNCRNHRCSDGCLARKTRGAGTGNADAGKSRPWSRVAQIPAQLSGGMQQRLAIAQAFIMQPRVLLLDEPFGALDPGIRKDMHALLLQLWGETRMTVFMVTHDLSEGFNLGTRLLVFDKVRIDPQAPNAYGARITYDIPLNETRLSALSGTAQDNVYALRG
jgi:NitT/TauT family transport system ATP-binding protein